MNTIQINEYITLVRQTMLPFQWEVLNDNVEGTEPSYSVANFRNAAIGAGEYRGTMWQDSDLYKWLEAAGSALETQWDENLYRKTEEAAALIVAAQGEDGYLNTYFALIEPQERWRNVEQCHELYCAGHMIEAAVAYARGSGRTKLLDAACRLADYIDTIFGPEEDKLHGYPGHPEIELALCKLYRATGEQRYIRLAAYFINERGKTPNFFLAQREARGYTTRWPGDFMPLRYFLAHKPVREQTAAVGHAVQAVYLYTGMADVAFYTGDEDLFAACRALWEDVTQRQMYITGAVGSSAIGEAFTVAYNLPNDRAYAETCAAVGLIFFARRMIELDGSSGEYGDVMERALYNGVLSGFGLDGESYFYSNPLEAYRDVCGKADGRGDPALAHIKIRRQKWHGCACCPTNAARLLASLQQYAFSFDAKGSTLRCQMIIPGEHTLKGEYGEISLRIETQYPWDGEVKLTVLSCSLKDRVDFALRIPDWVRGKETDIILPKGAVRVEEKDFLRICHRFQAGDLLALTFPMEIRATRANPSVRADVGKIALERGPLVYCLEQADHKAPLYAIMLSQEDTLSIRPVASDQLGGSVLLTGRARVARMLQSKKLYCGDVPVVEETRITAVPYFQWGNREETDMQVWIREQI